MQGQFEMPKFKAALEKGTRPAPRASRGAPAPLVESCWATNPRERPAMAEVLEHDAFKPGQEPNWC